MNDTDYILIQGWMGKRLGLRGNLLLCFALIHGYSRSGNGYFKGGLKYIADSIYCTEPTVIACIDKLIELDLIRKIDTVIKGHKRCLYSVKVTFEDGELVYFDDTKEILVGQTKEILVGQTKEILVNNTIIGNNNKKGDNNKSLSHKKGEEKPYRFVKPTIEQVAAYIQEKGLHFDAEHFFDYYESKGWMIGKNHMKDWKAACRTWEHQRNKERNNEEESQAVDEAEMAQWKKTQGWLYANVPRIADRIFQEDFEEMKRKARYKSDIVAEILKEINDSYFNGNNLSEFCVLAESEKYRNRIEA